MNLPLVSSPPHGGSKFHVDIASEGLTYEYLASFALAYFSLTPSNTLPPPLVGKAGTYGTVIRETVALSV